MNSLFLLQKFRQYYQYLKKNPHLTIRSIFDYLVFNRTDQTEQTFFKGIKKLQHGSQLTIKNSKLKIMKWYDLKERVSRSNGFNSAEEYRELFSEQLA